MSVELERFDPAEQSGRIVYEHLHRYALCREFVTGKRVLDLACGMGYGTAVLGTAAADCIGLDISASAIRAARKRYASENVKFVIGDCFDLPFEDGTFDVVVANEMIEHVEGHPALLAEIRRVLADKGLLLVSTPNKPVYNRYKPQNVFHIAEMEVPEFRKLLTGSFRHVQLTGLRMSLLSVSYALDSGDARVAHNLNAARIHLVAGENAAEPLVETGELQLDDPEYVLAVCSDAPLEPAVVSSSIFFDKRNDLWLDHEKIMAWASNLHEEDEVLRADVTRTRELLEEARSRANQLEDERADIAGRLEQLNASQANLTGALEGERQALAREIEAVRRASAARVSTLAELLGVMGQKPVEAKDSAILSSLFQINEALVTERLQRAQADERSRYLAEQIDAAAEQLSALRSAANEESRRLTAALDDQKLELEAERRRREDLELAQASLEDEVRLAKHDLSAVREALEVESRRREELESVRASLESEVRSVKHDLSAVREELESERRRPIENEAVPAVAAKDPDNAGETAISLLHRRTAAMLASAPARVVGRIAPPPERAPLPWHQKLLRKQSLLETSIFSSAWLARQDPDLAELSLRGFLSDQRCRTRSPHPLFDSEFYLRTYPDVDESGMSPLVHYVLHGWREGRDPHPLFTNDWYLAQNPDVASSGTINPLDHYLLHGWREGRRPNPLFDPRSYIGRYPDVEAGDFEPLTHFMLYGHDEGRELVIDGWGPSLPDVATRGGVLCVMERMLREPAVETLPASVSEPDDGLARPASSALWPPTPVDNFWPAQSMRELVTETHGEPLLGRIWYLLSLMERWQDRQDEFAASDDCRSLLDRMRQRAAAKAVAEDAEPSATVIIPVYNNVLDTLLCLASVLELDEHHDFEVIIADDGSTDATAALLSTISGNVCYLRQPRNLGFLGNCNAAATHARGRTIVLLNNDTLVFTGWLDGLLDPIATMTNVGLVGSKLINWDGTLQEAGGIFWRDGSAWNFGRNQDPRAPEFNYLKDVDYCSGASIAVPTRIWRELGGFDPVYAPAYCEDSDLAFRLREAGYRTLYNPASEVVHHEGRSHGRDVSSGVKAYQVSNNAKLLDRWQNVLARDHYPNAQNVLRARDRSFAKKHVLVIDHYVPQVDRDAGSRTLYQYMKVLIQDGFAVTFWPDNLWRDPIYTRQLQQLGIEVIYGAKFRNGFAQFIEQRADLYDFVFVSRPHVAKEYVTTIRMFSNVKIVYYGHDLHFARMQAAASSGQSVLAQDIEKMRNLELAVCSACDVILYPDPDEVRLVKDQIGGDKEFVANPVFLFNRTELHHSRAALSGIGVKAVEDRLLFVGGFRHDPNVDGIKWFVSDVMPLILTRRPGVKLNVVGSNVPADVLGLASRSVNLLGFVSDAELEDIYREADVAVAPLRYGAGVKGKVIEAMARAVPVATTSIGAQGIDAADNSLFIGDSAEALSDAVVRALEDRELAQRKATAALAFIHGKYSEEVMIEFFRRMAANG